MKTKNKLTLTICDPDEETTAWAAAKIRAAYLGELDNALAKATKAIFQNKAAKIKTKPLTIEICGDVNEDHNDL